jgi:hypothetical protein
MVKFAEADPDLVAVVQLLQDHQIKDTTAMPPKRGANMGENVTTAVAHIPVTLQTEDRVIEEAERLLQELLVLMSMFFPMIYIVT